MKKIFIHACGLILAIVLLTTGCSIPQTAYINDSKEPEVSYSVDKNNAPIASSDTAETPIPSPTNDKTSNDAKEPSFSTYSDIEPNKIPAYSNKPYISINGNRPYFSETDKTKESFEYYSELDELGRCGYAFACLGKDIMPKDEREGIGQVKPSGWQTVKYDIVEGKYLYNRCHLIGYQLSGENANEKNLITGTRYMNKTGMLPFENMVADFIKETGYHVLYRVSPIFDGDNLVAAGVLMEAYSVEDEGDGICFNVFVYNVQPGIIIDYANGDSSLDPNYKPNSEATQANTPSNTPKNTSNSLQSNEPTGSTYVLNTNTHKFHYSKCRYASQISSKNREEFNGSRDELIARGYEPCKNCNP